jgi:hypothetical protein
MKQTAVEWLLQRFESGDMYNVEDAQFIKHQALKMHKEEIEEAWNNGMKSDNGHFGTFKEYYKEIYERKTTESK